MITDEMMGEMIESGYGVTTNCWRSHREFAEEILSRFQIDYFAVQTVAEEFKIDYNVLCSAVRRALNKS